MKTMALVLMVSLFLPAAAIADGPYTLLNGTDLCQIDLAAGTLDLIGPTGIEAECLVYYTDQYLYAVSVVLDALIRIDPTTGGSTVVGPLGVDLSDPRVDLAVDDSGVMWMLNTGSMYEIDPQTGVATLSCEQQDPDTHMFSLAFLSETFYTYLEWPLDPVPLDCGLNDVGVWVDWMDGGPGSTLYAIYMSLSPWWDSDAKLLRIDSETGDFVYVVTFSDTDLRGLAFPPPRQPATAVPLLGLPALVLLFVSLAVAGVIVLRNC